MSYPSRCPHCGSDLTIMGSIVQRAAEIGDWEARINDGELDFGKFETDDTMEVFETYCYDCHTALVEEE